MFEFEGYTLDVAHNSLRAADREIPLRPKSFEVLRYLIENANRLVTKEELVQAIWPNVIVTDDALTHCVSEARQAIAGSKQALIATVPRRGYRFVATVSRIATSVAVAPQPPSGTAGGPPALILAGGTLAVPGAAAPPPPHPPLPAGEGSKGGARSESPLLDRPSVAVLPFANLSGDPQQDYFSDGIADDVITELSRFSELLVI